MVHSGTTSAVEGETEQANGWGEVNIGQYLGQDVNTSKWRAQVAASGPRRCGPCTPEQAVRNPATSQSALVSILFFYL